MNNKTRPRVAIIGGGGTGCALAWDLSLRGFRVSLYESGEFTSGTTGRHHGQLHCGARYAVGDAAIAAECMRESRILRAILPQAIEANGGAFVALTEEEADYADRFVEACQAAGIPARELATAELLASEPAVNHGILRAVWVPDASFDAFRLPLSFLAAARRLGAELHSFCRVVAISRRAGRCAGLGLRRADGSEAEADFDAVVNAGGAWADAIGRLAGLRIPVTPAAGAMVAVRGRLTDMVISRLGPPGDGDIVVPQRGLSIIGSTQRLADSPDGLLAEPEELAFLMRRGAELLPAFATQPVHAAWAAARPLAGLVSQADADGRKISRDMAILDHGSEGLPGAFTVLGGKATVLRAMAEAVADRLCAYFSIERPCRTASLVLPSWQEWYSGPPNAAYSPEDPGLEVLS